MQDDSHNHDGHQEIEQNPQMLRALARDAASELPVFRQALAKIQATDAAEAAKGQLKTKTDSDKINRPAERT